MNKSIFSMNKLSQILTRYVTDSINDNIAK